MQSKSPGSKSVHLFGLYWIQFQEQFIQDNYKQKGKIIALDNLYPNTNFALYYLIPGQENALKYKLIHNTKAYVNDYNDRVEPNVLNEHATAAFRYFHSSVQGTIQ